MISRKFVSFLIVSVFLCSFVGLSGGVTSSKSVSPLMVAAENAFREPTVPSPEPPHRIVPVSLLVYTEYVDSAPGEEWENTMSAINDTYGTDYYYTNLTDYTQIDTALPDYDILLIPEQEKANQTTTKMIGTAWAGSLADFVNNGGIIILMDYWLNGPDELGSGAHIYNESGLMQINEVGTALGDTLNLVNTSNALARGVASSWTAVEGAVAFNVSDGTTIVDNSTLSVVVHKSMGQGHVVLLGFDLSTRESNYDQLLGNAIRLHRHVVFDNSHNQLFNIFGDLTSFTGDLVAEGFAVSSMDSFSPTFFNACDVLVIPFCDFSTGKNYTTTEIDAIQEFVTQGGGLYILGEYGGWGKHLLDLEEAFGYEMNGTAMLYDSDENVGNDFWIYYDGSNLHSHSLTVWVGRIELYGSTGFLSMPSNAKSIIVTDDNGTSTWGIPPAVSGTDAADGVTCYAASTHEAGRVVVSGEGGFLSDSVDTDSDLTDDYHDSDNDVLAINTIRWLSAAGLKERIVLFDESHDPFGGITGQAQVLGSYVKFANYLTCNGYTIQVTTTFHSGMINNSHILVLCDGLTNYTTNEIAIIKAFVADGGGLFLLGDRGVYGDQVDPIGNEFGIDRNNTSYLDDSDDYIGNNHYIIYEDTNFGTHPIMEGISRIEVDQSTAFNTIGSGTALLTSDTDGTCTWHDGGIANGIAVFAATEHELGRIVYVTDVNFPQDVDTDGDGDVNFYDSDNNLFIVNAFQWLAENQAPVVEVTAPNGGETIIGSTTITWTITDPNKDKFTADVAYSTNSGNSWSVLATGLTATSWSWNTSGLPDSDQSLIRVEATDYELTGQDVSDTVFIVDNNGPTIDNIAHSPANPNTANIINVSAEVSDFSGIRSIIFQYTVNNGSLKTGTMMKISGDIYAGNFSTTFAVGDEVAYYIKAVDNNGFQTISSTTKFTVGAPPGIPGFELPIVMLGLLISVAILLVVRQKRQ
ncbi:MAG: hypothetical protein ACFFCZ_18895 [Promethearchaeota archaeon]